MRDAPLRRESLAPLRLVGIGVAARALGVGERTVRHAIDRGELPAYKVGQRAKVGVSDLRDWLERHRVRPPGR